MIDEGNVVMRSTFLQYSKNNDNNITQQIVPGVNYIPVTGKVLDVDDILHGVDATLDGWLTTGRFNAAFEKKLAAFLGVYFN